MKSAFFGPRQNHSLGKNPILVIDREGLIGEPLCLKLSKEFSVVFVSRSPSANVPFLKKIPEIPDNKYSHIIFIDEKAEDLEFLPKIIRKAKDVNSDFIFAQGLSSREKCVTDKILKLYPSSKAVIVGDVFDSELILKKESLKSAINKFIYQTRRFGKIQILGDGLRETYPVFLEDVVGELIDLIFGMHKSHSLFYLFPKHPVTEISLAHMIQKINPEVTVDFTRHDPRLGNITYPTGGLNLLGDKYPIAQKIRSIDMKKDPPVGGEEDDEDLNMDTKKTKSFPFFIVWGLIFLLIFPFIFTVLFSSLGLNTLNYANGEIDRGNFANVKSSARLSQALFYLGQQTLKILSLQAKIIGQQNNLKKISQDLDLGYKISDGILQAFNSEVYFSKILNGKSVNPIDDFTKGASFLKSSIVALDRVKAEGKIPVPILQKLESISPLIKFLSGTLDVMPSILGMETPKIYLILLQNNIELRPGGGIIDSYGILKFNLGKITEFTMHDVSDADQQLRGHVEPPPALRRYLPELHWYMKDSNFDVDFIKSAFSSSNFLFIETGQKVDGVIAVDATFIKSILHAIGPVYIENYKVAIDEKNLFPSITQKGDFLRSLSKAIITKVTSEKMSYLLMSQAISDALTQKHLLFAFKDRQNIFTVNGWSSSLWDERKDSGESVNDFVGINEANLGVNKINYYISRQVLQKVTLEDSGNISEELTINYKNESTIGLGGEYKNYLRIILPKTTNLSEISINDTPQNIVDMVTNPLVYEEKNFKAPQGLEVETTQEDNKAIFGFLVKIPAEKIVKVKLKYTLGSIFGLNIFSYNLKLFKQPGIDSIPYSFYFVYPSSFNIIKSSDGVNREDGRVTYSEKIVGDKNLIIDFAKK